MNPSSSSFHQAKRKSSWASGIAEGYVFVSRLSLLARVFGVGGSLLAGIAVAEAQSAAVAQPTATSSAGTSATPAAAPDAATPASGGTTTPAASGTAAADTVKLDTLSVTAKKATDGSQQVQAGAKAVLDQVPGAVSLIDNTAIVGQASNAQQVLAYQPGVYAQATSGTTANKISIRGSGLNTFYQGYVLGLKFLYDGLPITGPGGTQEDMLDITAVNYTEVLNGANAFTYASTSLGGAVNFVTNSGYTAPGLYGAYELGSYGYDKQQAGYGGVAGKLDYYVAVSHDETTGGFSDNTFNSGKDLIANIGYKFNDHIDTRITFRYREEEMREAGTITKADINNNPQLNLTPSGRKEPGSTFLTDTTTYTADDGSKLSLATSYHNYPLYNGWLTSTTPQMWESTDVNLTSKYIRQDEFFSTIPSTTTAVISDTRLVDGYVTGYNGTIGVDGFGSERIFTQYSGSQDAVLALGNDAEVIKKLWFSSGFSIIDITRDEKIEYIAPGILPNNPTTNPNGYPSSVNYSNWYLAPRVGLRYDLTKNAQLFTNLSRSVDGPVTWQMGSTSTPYLRPLQPQTAYTAELGVRGTYGIFEGSIDIYRSWVTDELLTVVVTPATSTTDAITANSNASPTIHQGIESALTTRLWGTADDSSDKILFRQSFTVNDFYYAHDSQFGNNQLPGIPKEMYQAELLYKQAKGFYVGVNLRAASSYYVDYANTLSASGYAVYGATIGYETPRWDTYLQFTNLTNKHYASATNTTYDAEGHDSADFYAGAGFGVVGGFSIKL